MVESATDSHALELVRRAVREARDGDPAASFTLRRAELELAGAQSAAPLRRVLSRVRESLDAGDAFADQVSDVLVRSGGTLERRRSFEAAQGLYELATELRPLCAKTALHAARAAREAGDPEAARAHYARVIALDDGGRLARLARMGEAILEGAGERLLSREIRHAVLAGDEEMAGVGLEARALLRCGSLRCREAIRDLCACALRYPDPDDRARVVERLAGLLLDEGDLQGAREALLLLHEIGDGAQRALAVERLYRVSERLGDRVGVYRWRGRNAPPAARQGGEGDGAGGSAGERRATLPLPVLQRWRDAVVEGARTT